MTEKTASNYGIYPQDTKYGVSLFREYGENMGTNNDQINAQVQALLDTLNEKEFQSDLSKIDTKGNRAAATRARKVLKEASDTIKNIRQSILDSFKDDKNSAE
jgi:ElaB/YqjD/DUF883 family membrane-anchored ribosome-binding protein